MNDWIATADRLPADGEVVLATGMKRCKWAVLLRGDPYVRDDDSWHIKTTSGWECCYPPTHWMPLPEPPK